MDADPLNRQGDNQPPSRAPVDAYAEALALPDTLAR